MSIDIDQQKDAALQIAHSAHYEQYDKSGIAYILHPLAVADMMPDVEHEIVALLHDVLEDSDEWTADDLLARGISRELVTDVEVLTKRRGQANLEYYQEILDHNDRVRVVKLADACHNLGRVARIQDRKTRERLIEKYRLAVNVLTSKVK